MNVWDKILRSVGLTRSSQIPYKRFDITWTAGRPVHVDIETKYGQRVIGAVDPWYPNEDPLHAS